MPRNITAQDIGVPIGTIVQVTLENGTYKAVTTSGEDITDRIKTYALKNAVIQGKALQLIETKANGTQWRRVSPALFNIATRNAEIGVSESKGINIAEKQSDTAGFSVHSELVEFIKECMKVKPRKLKIDSVWWKFAVRSALRGLNLLVVGPSGCGKTLLANALKVALGRSDRFFYVNLGGTQDPRSTLIGNTHFSPSDGTFVALSYFANAIQVPNAIILLDEASRAHPEAHNILMPVLDHTQRYLRVDEAADAKTIKVAPGVTFILTANVGSEYTATRTMDRALLDRCIIIEMQPLSESQEVENLRESFPEVSDNALVNIAKVAAFTRDDARTEAPQLGTIISTRMAEAWAANIYDGFSFGEAAEVCVYPYFAESGGSESPRTIIRQTVQKYLPTEFDDKKNPFKNGDPNKGRGAPWVPGKTP